MIFGDTGDLWRKWTLVLAGMVTVVSLIFIRFLRKYPKAAQEASDGKN
jgi:hypothetical protein